MQNIITNILLFASRESELLKVKFKDEPTVLQSEIGFFNFTGYFSLNSTNWGLFISIANFVPARGMHL